MVSETQSSHCIDALTGGDAALGVAAVVVTERALAGGMKKLNI